MYRAGGTADVNVAGGGVTNIRGTHFFTNFSQFCSHMLCNNVNIIVTCRHCCLILQSDVASDAVLLPIVDQFVLMFLCVLAIMADFVNEWKFVVILALLEKAGNHVVFWEVHRSLFHKITDII
jgi:hypothetical protein